MTDALPDIRVLTITLSGDDEWEPKLDLGDDFDEFTAIGVLVKTLYNLVTAEPEDD